MPTLLSQITALHDELTAGWHRDPLNCSGDGVQALVVEQHRQNFDLWHEEDRARAPHASHEQIAEIKRSIDVLNQKRNDLIEAIDRALMKELQACGTQIGGGLHSETPGMMIDRLSILSLKIFHTREQIERTDATKEHVSKNRLRLDVLVQQRKDLAECLDTLWKDAIAGRRHFKLYLQLKMYNDPELNPEIYRAKKGGTPEAE